MLKYTSLKSILNFVPDYVKEQEDEIQMLSWAFQGYREAVRQSLITDNYQVAIIKIDNHKGVLPNGMKKIMETGWSTTNPVSNLPENSQQVFYPTQINNVNILLAEAIHYQSVKNHTTLMRYVGQNPELLDNSCLNIFCPTCKIEFSVNKSLTQITTSEKSGYVAIVYTVVAKEGEDFLIPDVMELQQGLAYFVEAKHWQGRMGRKEENAYNIYIQNLEFAKNYFNQFIKNKMLQAFSPDGYKRAILGKFDKLKDQSSAINRKALWR